MQPQAVFTEALVYLLTCEETDAPRLPIHLAQIALIYVSDQPLTTFAEAFRIFNDHLRAPKPREREWSRGKYWQWASNVKVAIMVRHFATLSECSRREPVSMDVVGDDLIGDLVRQSEGPRAQYAHCRGEGMQDADRELYLTHMARYPVHLHMAQWTLEQLQGLCWMMSDHAASTRVTDPDGTYMERILGMYRGRATYCIVGGRKFCVAAFPVVSERHLLALTLAIYTPRRGRQAYVQILKEPDLPRCLPYTDSRDQDRKNVEDAAAAGSKRTGMFGVPSLETMLAGAAFVGLNAFAMTYLMR